MKREANWSEFRARLPARSRHFAGIPEQLGNRDSFKLAARALAGEILNATNDVSAVFRALDDQLQAGFDLGGIVTIAKDQLGPSKDAGERVVDVVSNSEGEFSERGHFLSVNLLFALCFVAQVGLGDGFETLAEAFAGGVLLGVGE